MRVALRRAAHQLFDRPLVFDDPLAVAILGEEYQKELLRTPRRLDRPHSAALRAFVVARSRFAEDTLAEAMARGVSQYVLLGAGLDTFGYRNPYPMMRVFEVDRPATQIWKRNLLESNRIPDPGSVEFVSVDFELDSLPERLSAAGFDAKKAAVFAWLGVVPYLTHKAFRSTLNFISRMPGDSGLVMDYGQPREVLPYYEQLEYDSLAMRVQLAGEPFRLSMTAEQMCQELLAFSHVEDLGSAEINARYFNGRADQLRVRGRAGRLVRAWI